MAAYNRLENGSRSETCSRFWILLSLLPELEESDVLAARALP